MDMSKECQEICIIVDWFAFKSILKQMSTMLVFIVVIDGIAQSDFLNYFCDDFTFFLDEQVHVVGHQTIGK